MEKEKCYSNSPSFVDMMDKTKNSLAMEREKFCGKKDGHITCLNRQEFNEVKEKGQEIIRGFFENFKIAFKEENNVLEKINMFDDMVQLGKESRFFNTSEKQILSPLIVSWSKEDGSDKNLRINLVKKLERNLHNWYLVI